MILLITFFPPLLRWDLRTPPKSFTHSTFDTHEGSPALSIPYSGCSRREPEHREADTPLNDQTAEPCEQIASHHAYWLLRTSTMRHIWCSSRLQRLILITRYITDASSKKSPTPYIFLMLQPRHRQDTRRILPYGLKYLKRQQITHPSLCRSIR